MRYLGIAGTDAVGTNAVDILHMIVNASCVLTVDGW